MTPQILFHSHHSRQNELKFVTQFVINQDVPKNVYFILTFFCYWEGVKIQNKIFYPFVLSTQ